MIIVISHAYSGGVGKSRMACAYIDYRLNQAVLDPNNIALPDVDKGMFGDLDPQPADGVVDLKQK